MQVQNNCISGQISIDIKSCSTISAYWLGEQSYLLLQLYFLYNHLHTSCSCDAMISGYWMDGLLVHGWILDVGATHPLQYICLIATQWKETSALLHMTKDFKVQINLFSAKTFKCTIIDCHKSPMVLNGLQYFKM